MNLKERNIKKLLTFVIAGTIATTMATCARSSSSENSKEVVTNESNIGSFTTEDTYEFATTRGENATTLYARKSSGEIYNGRLYRCADASYMSTLTTIEQALIRETLVNPSAIITYVSMHGIAYSYQNFVLIQAIDLNTREALDINLLETPQIIINPNNLADMSISNDLSGGNTYTILPIKER